MRNGILIAIEGIDGAGKTTQVDLLERYLRLVSGVPVVRSKEPTDGPWGKKIRESATTGRMSLEDELAAFIEDRREHVRDVIQPALDAGKVVILDRYFYSTIAYQGSRGANVGAIERQMLGEFPVPDVAFVIDVPAEVGLARVRQGRGEVPNVFEQVTTLDRCRYEFMKMCHFHHNLIFINGNDAAGWVQGAINQRVVRDVLEPYAKRFRQNRRDNARVAVYPVLDL